MPEQYLSHIPVGREGYVYLIHAEGTNRYKIGRSVNPIDRASEIQKQAPYPLKIIKSFWTLDAITDEAKLHKWYKKYRVFGEWFELTDTKVENSYFTNLEEVKDAFDNSYTMGRLAHNLRFSLRENLGITTKDEFYCTEAEIIILNLYSWQIQNVQDLLSFEKFVRETLVNLIYEAGFSKNDIVDGKFSVRLDAFICGTINTFTCFLFNKKLI